MKSETILFRVTFDLNSNFLKINILYIYVCIINDANILAILHIMYKFKEFKEIFVKNNIRYRINF